MYNIVKNPIPHSGLFTCPSLEQIQQLIEGMPKEHRANANLVFMFTLNSCHDLVKENILDKEISAQ